MTRRQMVPQPDPSPVNTNKCPFGTKGDTLWVREEHKIWFSDDKSIVFCEFKDGSLFLQYYKRLPIDTLNNLLKRKTLGKWQRARFLPKALCRLHLKITNIRMERLQDISEADCQNEGIDYHYYNGEDHYLIYPPKNKSLFRRDYNVDNKYASSTTPFFANNPAWHSFKSLWNRINDNGSWDANPWVWIIEFKCLSN